MQKPSYKIKIGSTAFEPFMNQEIISIGVDLDIDIPSDGFQIILKSGTKASAIKSGDTVTIELGYEGSLFKVLTGTVDTIKPTIPETIVSGLGTISTLTITRVNQVYEKQSAGAIIKDLASKAGIAVKDVQDGLNFPMYVADDTKDCYSHMRELARKCGFDLFMTGNGRLMFKKYERQNPKPLKYGRDIIEAEVYELTPITACVKVYGESPSSLKGADTAHWISKKMVEGIAGNGSEIFLIEDPTVRDKDTADKVAASYLETIMTPLSGTLKVLGNARVGLGDTIEIKDIPDTRMNGEFEVTSISHSFNKNEGFVSAIGWVKKIDISPTEPPLAAPPSMPVPPKPPSPLEEQLESAKSELEDKRLALQDTVENAEMELEKGLFEVNKAISEVDKVAKEMTEAAEDVKKTAMEGAKEALAKADELKNELEAAKKKVEDGLAEAKAKYEEFKKDAYAEIEKHEQEIKNLRDKAEKPIHDLEKERKKVEDKKTNLENTKKKAEGLTGDAKDKELKRITELEVSIKEAAEKIASAEKEIEGKRKEMESKIKELEDKKDKIKTSVEDAEKEMVSKAEETKKQLDKATAETEAQITEAKNTAEKIEKEATEKFDETVGKVEKTRKEAIAKLEELKKTYSEVREKVMEAKKQAGMD